MLIIRFFKFLISTGGCLEEIGGIQHELFHALGFYHEMNRPNRDDYIWIFWKNLNPAFIRDFQLANGTRTFGLPYDYESIMHYGFNDFSINNGPTIVPKKKNAMIGQRDELTEFDAKKLIRLYKCSKENDGMSFVDFYII